MCYRPLATQFAEPLERSVGGSSIFDPRPQHQERDFGGYLQGIAAVPRPKTHPDWWSYCLLGSRQQRQHRRIKHPKGDARYLPPAVGAQHRLAHLRFYIHTYPLTSTPHVSLSYGRTTRTLTFYSTYNISLTWVAMSPFSSTIDGGRSALADCCAVSASAAAVAAVEDARIHRLGCRLLLLQLLSTRPLEAERPGHAAGREWE